MLVYYDDRRVRITSAELRVDGRAYPLDELTYVWRRQARGSRRRLSRRATRNLLMLGTGGVGLLCYWIISTTLRLRLWFRHDLPVAAVVVILVAGFLAGTALTWPLWELVLSGMDQLHIHGMNRHELWAQRRGEELLLLSSSDALRFGQIYRALSRALEGE